MVRRMCEYAIGIVGIGFLKNEEDTVTKHGPDRVERERAKGREVDDGANCRLETYNNKNQIK